MDGFVEYHCTICAKPDCPAKKKFVKNSKFTKAFKYDTDPEIIKITYLIENFLSLGLLRFQNDPKLKIHHALFLLDKINKKQQALSEIMTIEIENTTYVQEFLVFRLK